jgi:hypothetical protein
MIDGYTISTVIHIRKLKFLTPKMPPPLNSLVYSTSRENAILSQMGRSAVKV